MLSETRTIEGLVIEFTDQRQGLSESMIGVYCVAKGHWTKFQIPRMMYDEKHWPQIADMTRKNLGKAFENSLKFLR